MKLLSNRCSIALLSFFTLFLPAWAQFQNLNPTGAGCIDLTGFLSCYSTLETNVDYCINSFCPEYDSEDYLDCVITCGYVELAQHIGCWIQSCWNMIYSCEYQGTCIQYLEAAGPGLFQENGYIPFYPAPQNAHGSCSCNIGEVYGNISALAIEEENVCDNFDLNGQEYLANCQCCQASQILSNVFDLCPTSDLTYLTNVANLLQEYKNIASYSPDKCAILNTNPGVCQSIYGFSIGQNKKWINPYNLPGGGLPGTSALFNGPGSITAITPATIVLEFFPAVTTTIIPVNNPANKAVNAREVGSSDSSRTTVLPPHYTPIPWLPPPSKSSSSIIGSTPISSSTTHPTQTSLSTITIDPNTSTLNCPTKSSFIVNTSTLNCPTKTSFTIPVSCPPVTPPPQSCTKGTCALEEYISMGCDCPDSQVYTQFVDLACPATTGCPPAECVTGYTTVLLPCPMTLESPGMSPTAAVPL